MKSGNLEVLEISSMLDFFKIFLRNFNYITFYISLFQYLVITRLETRTEESKK